MNREWKLTDQEIAKVIAMGVDINEAQEAKKKAWLEANPQREMNYTKTGREIRTLGDAYQVLREHGLEGDYCPKCDQFSQARILVQQDEVISEMYEELKQVNEMFLRVKAVRPLKGYEQVRHRAVFQLLVLAKVEGGKR